MRRLAALSVMVLALGACAQTASSDARYDLAEFSISGPERLTAVGEIVVSNSGQYPHTLVVTDVDGSVVAASGLVAPGATSSLAVDLTAGNYQFTCRIVTETPDGSIVDHFEEGMSQRVEVSA
jgi:hypothetical protein